MKASKTLSAGNPVCEAGLAMRKDGKTTDNGRTSQKFCCPFRQSKTSVCPCNHKNWNNGKKNQACTKYKIIPTDYRLSIDRECLRFKRIYALRTERERYNSRFKACLDRNDYGCVTETVRQTSTHWPTSPL